MLEKHKIDVDNMEGTEVKDLLDRLLELKKEQNKVNPIKITICIVGGIVAIMIIGMLCYHLSLTDFSLENILSTLLAFFSIFISIFFYFKADETSTNFYKSSYDFMKDISVTLGKIEERFGEKLNSLNDKISHLDNISSEKSKEIQEQKDDKDKIIDDLMNKANLNQQQKEKYRQEINEKERQIESLKREQYNARREADYLRSRLIETREVEDRLDPPTGVLRSLLQGDTSSISPSGMKKLTGRGYIDQKGQINEAKILNELSRRGLL